ncbi:hypothetical protein FH972_027109 [Carpinus fangiana]|uniref:ABC transporter domain-containing protein n=1 Tax=Carpinus fangiana TaxID=176857 RepID=A0A5N6L643_9ROSI|nr:hypothetical protein FH972_027109 [Carpinus fangiana]
MTDLRRICGSEGRTEAEQRDGAVMALDRDGRGAGEEKKKRKKKNKERNHENRKQGKREKEGNKERGAWVLLREKGPRQQILKDINLGIYEYEGEVHTIMVKNGSGKSTLAKVLVSHPDYEVTGGSAVFKGENLLDMEPNRGKVT